MGLIELSSLAAIVSAAFGGGSLLVSILPFLQLKGRYESLRKALRSIESPKDGGHQSIYGNKGDWLELVQWLDRGEVLLVLVQQRIIRRALIAGVALIAIIATIPLDMFAATSSGRTWHDVVAVVAVTIVPRLAFFKKWLLTDAEKKFLHNFRDLEEAFYRREVAAKIDLFNAVFQRLFSHVSGSSEEELAVLQDQLRDLSKRVSEISAKSPKPSVPPGKQFSS